MTTNTRFRVIRPHRADCVGRAQAAGWRSPWWTTGRAIRRSATGRTNRKGRTPWLTGLCLFHECDAKAVVNAKTLAGFTERLRGWWTPDRGHALSLETR